MQSAAWYLKFTDRIFGAAPEATIQDIMSEGVFSLHINDTLNKALKLLAEEHIHSFVVLDDQDKAVGMLSTAIVLDALADETPFETPLSRLLMEPVVFATAKTSLKDALLKMKRNHEYKIIIADENNIVSNVLTQEEIIQYFAEHLTK